MQQPKMMSKGSFKAVIVGGGVPVVLGVVLHSLAPTCQRLASAHGHFYKALCPHVQRLSAELRSSPLLVVAGAVAGYFLAAMLTSRSGRPRYGGGGGASTAHWRLLTAAGVGAAVPALFGVALSWAIPLLNDHSGHEGPFVSRVQHYAAILDSLPCLSWAAAAASIFTGLLEGRHADRLLVQVAEVGRQVAEVDWGEDVHMNDPAAAANVQQGHTVDSVAVPLMPVRSAVPA